MKGVALARVKPVLPRTIISINNTCSLFCFSHALPFDFVPSLNVKPWQCIQTKRSSIEFPLTGMLGQMPPPPRSCFFSLSNISVAQITQRGFPFQKVYFKKSMCTSAAWENEDEWVKFKKQTHWTVKTQHWICCFYPFFGPVRWCQQRSCSWPGLRRAGSWFGWRWWWHGTPPPPPAADRRNQTLRLPWSWLFPIRVYSNKVNRYKLCSSTYKTVHQNDKWKHIILKSHNLFCYY